jgi:16S rRNA (cytidine1402-2'-O)-methyltransferase
MTGLVVSPRCILPAVENLGRLFVVATPIGNLGDLSPRAQEVLRGCDRVLAEDTRRTAQMLGRFRIDRPLISLHEHNERSRLAPIVSELLKGGRYALVTDAGTPGVSDPGTMLVREARKAGVAIESVAGPSALAAALAASGFPAEPALHLGFPPSRSGERQRFFEKWGGIEATLVLFEAPHRIEGCFADLAKVLGSDRPAILLREMTKLHEEGIDGTLGSILEEIRRRGEVKGEMVVVVAPNPKPSRGSGIHRISHLVTADLLRARISALVAEGMERADALREVAKAAGLSRSEVYRRLFVDSEKREGDDPDGEGA